MKRVSHLFERIISDSNLIEAIETVNKSHRWNHYPDKPNKTVLWVERNREDCIKKLREMLIDGFEPSPVRVRRRYDHNAAKWREIAEPKLFPDQYIHHALVQVLRPVMMRGMDRHVCNSIKGRGVHYGMKRIKKWMKSDIKGTKWCAELDIKQFYPSIREQDVIERFRCLVKDEKVIDLIHRLIKDGVLIGASTSPWISNTLLQPLDAIIRTLGLDHYIRYADNFTLFSRTKKCLRKAVRVIRAWLAAHGMKIKENWQIFPVRARLPNALGYRYMRGVTLVRKRALLRLRQQLRRFYKFRDAGRRLTAKFCQGLISRLGMLRHCNARYIYQKYIRKKTQKHLKAIIRYHSYKEAMLWSTFLEQQLATAS